MKARRCCSILTLTVCGFSFGYAQNPPPPDADPFAGLWKANAAKSKPKLNKQEADYIRSIERLGPTLIFASGSAKDGMKRQYTIECDGRFHPIPTGPQVACTYASARRVIGETLEPTGKHDFWTREVSDDGREMKILSFRDAARTKLDSTMVLDRIN